MHAKLYLMLQKSFKAQESPEKFITFLNKTNLLNFKNLGKIFEFPDLSISIQGPKPKTRKPRKFPTSSNKTITSLEKMSAFSSAV